MKYEDEMFAVVDLETTGSSYRKGGRIIQVGITLVKEDRVVQEYDFMVNPGKKIPVVIENLTGISNRDVQAAPYFEDVADYIFNLLNGCTFVAHNINFDYRFLNQSFRDIGLPELTIPGIDTVELTKVLFPTLDSYRLSDLSKFFGFSHENIHDAAGDARATAELFILLKSRAVSLPLVTLEKLNVLAIHTQRNNSDFFEMCLELSRHNKKKLASSLIIVNGLAVNDKKSHLEQTDYRQKSNLTSQELWQAYQERFGLQKRADQLDMINKIETFFSQGRQKDFAIEAPAGFGKTMAYLLPAVLTARPDKKVVISTSTLLLQEQLEEVVAHLEKASPFSFRYARLSSRQHLIHLEKFANIKLEKLVGMDALIMMGLFVWLTETETGDLSELSTSYQSASLLEEVAYQHNEFDISEKWYAIDFYRYHQENAKQASLLITNHAYLSHHIETIADICPDGNFHLIIDEAHRLPTIYKDKEKKVVEFTELRKKVSKFAVDVRNYREHLEQHATTTFPHYELINLEFSMDQLIHGFIEIENHLELKFECKETKKPFEKFFYLDKDELKTSKFQRFSRKLLLHFEEVIITGKRYVESDQPSEGNTFLQRIQSFMLLLEKKKKDFSVLLSPTPYGYYAVKCEQQLGSNRFSLEYGEWNIGDKLQARLHSNFSKVLYISASLFLNEGISYFSRKIGIKDLDAYSYASETEGGTKELQVFVPNDILPINQMGQHDWENMLTHFIFNLAIESHKKILVLFNSNHVLEQVLKGLRGLNEKEKTNIDFLAQGFSGSQRRVHRRFLEAEKAVLLGSGMYWEGIDFPEQPVDLLIMTRLPFDPPETPENRAIETFYSTHDGRNAFHLESLPKMIMRLVQGMGRISRQKGQKGIMICLDTRFLHSPYAKQIQFALPKGVSVKEKSLLELTKL